MRRGSTSITWKPRPSSTPNSGIQYTPVDSMTTVSTPHSVSQSAKRYRSAESLKLLHRLFRAVGGHRDEMAGGAHVDARRVQVQWDSPAGFVLLLWRVFIIPSTITV